MVPNPKPEKKVAKAAKVETKATSMKGKISCINKLHLSKINKMIDLRSDTVTKPSKEMLEAMFQAPVGDDVFGEDPTVNELQDYCAQLFGMEAALYCSSGTQTNQIAINVHVQPGAEVICHKESHVFKYEGGGIARNSGASIRTIDGNRGRLKAVEIEEWINPAHDVHYPLTQLVSLEDTANRGGGAIYHFPDIVEIKKMCDRQNLPLHLDGARLFNSLVETNISYSEYATNFDSISICLSKGLGAPVGSILLGKKSFIDKARRVRKVFGGGMRQAGTIAAGGLYALKNNVQKLKEDHLKAKQLEICLLERDWVADVIPVETNIVVVILKKHEQREQIIELLAKENIRIMAFGPGMLRMVTHLDVSMNEIDQVCEALKKVKI
jgi:threonine aldolase